MGQVESIPTSCPRCEALGAFRPRQRPVDDNIIEVFIACTTCNWEQILYESTPEMERLRRLEHRWQAYNRVSLARYGVPSSMARAHLKRITRELHRLEDEIPD